MSPRRLNELFVSLFGRKRELGANPVQTSQVRMVLYNLGNNVFAGNYLKVE